MVYECSLSASISSGTSPKLTHISTYRIADPETLVTSFVWMTDSAFDSVESELRICATLTNGEVGLATVPLRRKKSNQEHFEPAVEELLPFEILYTHSLEAWITTIAPSSWNERKKTIFSGGDDAVLSCISSPKDAIKTNNTTSSHQSSTNAEDASEKICDPFASDSTEASESKSKLSTWTQDWSNRRTHGAGVTALLPLTVLLSSSAIETIPEPLNAQSSPSGSLDPSKGSTGGMSNHILLTGSYDDTLRILLITHESHQTADPVRQPKVLHEVKMSGGVWRVKVLFHRRKRTANLSDIHFSPVIEFPDQGNNDTPVRPKDEKEEEITLVVCCMYAGAFIVRLRFKLHALHRTPTRVQSQSSTQSDEAQQQQQQQHQQIESITCTHEILAHFAEHESICYACDLQIPENGSEDDAGSNERREAREGGETQNQSSESETRRIVSCSFYDRRVCLWKWDESLGV